MDLGAIHNSSGMFPESMLPRRRNATIEKNLSPIHFGKIPENLFSPRSIANM